ncbi:hypothetical protein ACFFX0_20490 [Citricoccus parietis]|uniref:Uncharacterized protein n=1 Tax=Citricoccus parietis TaxID=592307 RepID=A0ABV5G3C2_9MICC
MIHRYSACILLVQELPRPGRWNQTVAIPSSSTVYFVVLRSMGLPLLVCAVQYENSVGRFRQPRWWRGSAPEPGARTG